MSIFMTVTVRDFHEFLLTQCHHSTFNSSLFFGHSFKHFEQLASEALHGGYSILILIEAMEKVEMRKFDKFNYSNCIMVLMVVCLMKFILCPSQCSLKFCIIPRNYLDMPY